MRDYFQDLGVDRSANLEEIRRAYLRLVKTFHPDRIGQSTPEAERKFLEIQEAYQHLNSDEKVAQVRGFLSLRLTKTKRKPIEVVKARTLKSAELGRNDLLIELPLSSFSPGRRIQIEYEVLDPCAHCFGSGRGRGARWESCQKCGAKGYVEIHRGANHWRKSCEECAGEGRLATAPCEECHGTGTATHMARHQVEFPERPNELLAISNAGQRERTGSKRGRLVIRWR